ncbi:probable metal-nicotianamine transporter YSL7 [Tanacetum coccineum]
MNLLDPPSTLSLEDREDRSLILFIWEKRNKAEAAAFRPTVASGLICGEGLWSVPKSILAIAKIYPPICMKFLS